MRSVNDVAGWPAIGPGAAVVTLAAAATVLYGASYYHEYMPYERLEEDVRLMEQAGVSVIRLGEARRGRRCSAASWSTSRRSSAASRR